MRLIAKDVFGNNHEVDPHGMTWRIHAYGVVIEGGKVLLSPQHDGAYDLPGGKIDMNEMVENGLIREVKEETGIDVTVKSLLGVEDIFFKVTFREPQEVWHSVMLYYACMKIGGEITADNLNEQEKQYVKAAEWIEADALPHLKRASSVDYLQFVQKAIDLS